MTWSNIECRDHNACECNLEFKLLDPIFDNYAYTVKRSEYQTRQTMVAMIIRGLAHISSTWGLVSGRIVPISKRIDWEYVKICFSSQVFSNMIKIPPYFKKNSGTRSQNLVNPGPVIARGLKLWDCFVFSKFGMRPTISMLEDMGVFKVSKILNSAGSDWEFVENNLKHLTLRAQICRKMSSFNRVMTGGRYGQYQRSTLEDLYKTKLIHGLRKFDQPTNELNKKLRALAPIMKKAMDRMYAMMNVDKHIGQYQYDPDHDVFSGIPSMSSAGCRAGISRRVLQDDGNYIAHTVAGKKIDQMEYAKRDYLETLEGAKKGIKVKRNDMAYVIVQKMEAVNDYSIHEKVERLYCEYNESKYRCRDELIKFEKMLEELKLKFRNYVIPFATDYMLVAHVQKHRQGIERDGPIRVGDSWWGSGGQRLMEYLQITDEQIDAIVKEFGEFFRPVIGDGDITGLDMGIKRFFMELYTITGGRYYKFKDMNDKQTYRIMVTHCLEAISARITHFFGDEWRVVMGQMPSGSYETSHGDSWIMLLLFNLFVQYVWEKNPHLRQVIDMCCKKGWQNIVVYGDDHITRTVKGLSKVLGEQAFVDFLAEFCDLLSRDVRENVTPLSELDNYGGLKTKGIVFLKKYLIKTPSYMKMDHVDMPSVVPFRPLDTYLHRVAFGTSEDRTLIDQIMSTIGNAYDTMGTNLVAYNFLQHLYSQLVDNLGGSDNWEIIARMMHERMLEMSIHNSQKDITKLMRKSSITMEEMLQGFPPLRNLIARNAGRRESFRKYF